MLKLLFVLSLHRLDVQRLSRVVHGQTVDDAKLKDPQPLVASELCEISNLEQPVQGVAPLVLVHELVPLSNVVGQGRLALSLSLRNSIMAQFMQRVEGVFPRP